jgi:esterase
MALKSPERVERLVVCDIAPVKYKRMVFKSYVEKLQSIDLSKITRRIEVDPLISDVIESRAVRAFLMGNLTTGADGLAWQVNLDTLGREMETIGGVPALRMDANYSGETLFMNGALSDYIQSCHHQLIRHLFPNVKFVTIEGAGHWLHAEKPHEFMDILNRFLQ